MRVRQALSGHTVAKTKSGRGRATELFRPIAAELADFYPALGRPHERTLVFPPAATPMNRPRNCRQRV